MAVESEGDGLDSAGSGRPGNLHRASGCFTDVKARYFDNMQIMHSIVGSGMLAQGLGSAVLYQKLRPEASPFTLAAIATTGVVGKEVVIAYFYQKNHRKWARSEPGTNWWGWGDHPLAGLPKLHLRLANLLTSLSFSNGNFFFFALLLQSSFLGGSSNIKKIILAIMAGLGWTASLHMNVFTYNYLLGPGLEGVLNGFPNFNLLLQGKFSEWLDRYFYMQAVERMAYPIMMTNTKDEVEDLNCNLLAAQADTGEGDKYIEVAAKLGLNASGANASSKVVTLLYALCATLCFLIIAASLFSFVIFPRAITQLISVWRGKLKTVSPLFAEIVAAIMFVSQFLLDPGGVVICWEHHDAHTTCLAGSEQLNNFFHSPSEPWYSLLYVRAAGAVVLCYGMLFGLGLNSLGFLFKGPRYWQQPDDPLNRYARLHWCLRLAVKIPAWCIVIIGASANYLQTQATTTSTSWMSWVYKVCALLGPALIEQEAMTLTILQWVRLCAQGRECNTDRESEELPLLPEESGNDMHAQVASQLVGICNVFAARPFTSTSAASSSSDETDSERDSPKTPNNGA